MIANNTYPFELPLLPYAYDALEPSITKSTMEFHHDKHFKTYVDSLNKALEPYPQYHSWTLAELLTSLSELPDGLKKAVRNHGGGVYSHDLYFDMMTPDKKEIPSWVADAFGGAAQFLKEMKSAAVSQFGSGYAWLVSDSSGALSIIALPNQDNPLSQGFFPILALDVWEHAYYLKYQNLRADYIDHWFEFVNWDAAGKRIEQKK